MIEIRTIFLLLCCIHITKSLFGQVDTIPRPTFIIKTTPTVAFLFLENNQAEIGYETGFSDRWSYGGYVGYGYISPFYNYINPYQNIYAAQEIRRYKVNGKFFMGLNLWGRYSRERVFYYFSPPSGDYSRNFYLRQSLGAISFITGIQHLFSKQRISIDFYGGAGIGALHTRFDAITDLELEEMKSDIQKPFDHYPGTKPVPVLLIGLKIGFVRKE